MSEEYVGLCRSKGWVWKRSKLEIADFKDLEVGSSACILSTKASDGFDLKGLPEGVTCSIDGAGAVLRTRLSDNRKVNISRFEALKKFVETISVADKAVLASRKSSSQIQVLKCGSK